MASASAPIVAWTGLGLTTRQVVDAVDKICSWLGEEMQVIAIHPVKFCESTASDALVFADMISLKRQLEQCVDDITEFTNRLEDHRRIVVGLFHEYYVLPLTTLDVKRVFSLGVAPT